MLCWDAFIPSEELGSVSLMQVRARSVMNHRLGRMEKKRENEHNLVHPLRTFSGKLTEYMGKVKRGSWTFLHLYQYSLSNEIVVEVQGKG